MSATATRSVRVDNDEKADRIFEALAGSGEHLTRNELCARTGLSVAQFRAGWSTLKRTLNGLCIMEPHREDSVYFLAGEDDGDRAKLYELWQARNVFTRLGSLAATIAQMRSFDDQHHTIGRGHVYAASKGVEDARAAMRTFIRAVGADAGLSEKKIEAWVANS